MDAPLIMAALGAASATPAWAMLAYLVAGVLFILALRGLSSPASSQQGNRYGMVGMAIAVATTLATHNLASLPEIAVAIAIGAAIGLVTARRIAMTAMPQLVAAFHSLVGLAAVLVAAAAFLNPDAFGIVGADGLILPVSRIEMGLGAAIGAITFSGSVIAFAKLNGNMSGKPILLPARHVLNLGVLAVILGLTGYFTIDQSPWVFWTITILAFAIGFLLIIAFFLITEHTAHVFGVLPYLLLLLCPLLHLFMHGGHGDHADHADHQAQPTEGKNS